MQVANYVNKMKHDKTFL